MRQRNFCRTEPGAGGGLEKGNFSEFGACESGNRGLGDSGSNIKYVYHIQSTGKQKEGVAHTGKGKKKERLDAEQVGEFTPGAGPAAV